MTLRRSDDDWSWSEIALWWLFILLLFRLQDLEEKVEANRKRWLHTPAVETQDVQ